MQIFELDAHTLKLVLSHEHIVAETHNLFCRSQPIQHPHSSTLGRTRSLPCRSMAESSGLDITKLYITLVSENRLNILRLMLWQKLASTLDIHIHIVSEDKCAKSDVIKGGDEV